MKCSCPMLLILLSCSLTFADNLEVPSQYTNIEDALAAASDGDHIVLAPDTYSGAGFSGITISDKSITIRSQDPDDPNLIPLTAINCLGSSESYSRAFIINQDSNVTIQGITIANGYSSFGGAILLTTASLSIENSVIDNCSSANTGGAISIDSGSTFISQNCSFTDNNSTDSGGAIYSSGDSTITIQNSTLTRNYSQNDGGAIIIENNDNAVLIDTCSITNNSSYNYGAGINFTGCTNTTVRNSLIAGNDSESHGGGIYYTNSTYASDDTPSNFIINTTITENRCGSEAEGGGLRLHNSELLIANTVIWDNLAYIDNQDPDNNGRYPEVAISGDSSLLQMAFCLVQGGTDPDFQNDYVFLELGSLVDELGGSIEGPPAFTTAGSWDDNQWTAGNYLPTTGSYCFNGGGTDYIDQDLTLDLAGQTRAKGATVDIGAYEMEVPDGPDLTGTMELSLKYSGELIPGDKGKATVTVTNSGNEDAEGEIGVSLYLSEDAFLSSSDTLIYSSDRKTKVKFQIDRLRPKSFRISFVVPGDIPAGNYYFLAKIDDTNGITEADESMISNVIASEEQTISWKFGTFGDRRNAKLTLDDADGITNQYTIKDGWAEIDSNRSDIDVYSSSERCTLSVKAKSRDDIPVLGNITCDGHLSISARGHNLAGDIYISGTMPKLQIQDIPAYGPGYTVTILGSSNDGRSGSTIQAKSICDLYIDSPDYPIKAIKVDQWIETAGQPPVIETPWIKSLSSKGNFEASLIVSGEYAPRDVSIGSAKASGDIKNCTWIIEGDIKNITANALENFYLFHGSAEGITEPTGNASDIANQYSLSLALKDSSNAMIDSTIITWEVAKFSYNRSAGADGTCYFEFFESRRVTLPDDVINPAEPADQSQQSQSDITAIWQPQLINPYTLF